MTTPFVSTQVHHQIFRDSFDRHFILDSFDLTCFEVFVADTQYNSVYIGLLKAQTDAQLSEDLQDLTDALQIHASPPLNSAKSAVHSSSDENPLELLFHRHPAGSLKEDDDFFKGLSPSTRLIECSALGYEEGLLSALRDQALVEATDGRGWSALHWLCASRSSRIRAPMIQSLLSAGADPSKADQNGNTPLHLIAEFRGSAAEDHYECFELLLTAGADPFMSNLQGQSALDLALVHFDDRLKSLATSLSEQSIFTRDLAVAPLSKPRAL